MFQDMFSHADSPQTACTGRYRTTIKTHMYSNVQSNSTRMLVITNHMQTNQSERSKNMQLIQLKGQHITQTNTLNEHSQK